jgi:hypothetical protein
MKDHDWRGWDGESPVSLPFEVQQCHNCGLHRIHEVDGVTGRSGWIYEFDRGLEEEPSCEEWKMRKALK